MNTDYQVNMYLLHFEHRYSSRESKNQNLKSAEDFVITTSTSLARIGFYLDLLLPTVPFVKTFSTVSNCKFCSGRKLQFASTNSSVNSKVGAASPNLLKLVRMYILLLYQTIQTDLWHASLLNAEKFKSLILRISSCIYIWAPLQLRFNRMEYSRNFQ